MSLALIIGLLAMGIILILVEIFLTPGFVVGVIGSALMLAGVYGTFNEYGNTTGAIVLISSTILLTVLIVAAFRNGAWDKFSIKDEIEGKANNIHKLSFEIGDKGTSLSALRPSGMALIDGQKVEVHTEGGFILKDVEIEVVKLLHNKIFVKQLT